MCPNHRQSQRGFTLVELISVIVILAVLAIGVFSYLGFGAQVFTDTVGRDRLASDGRFVVERLSRELRNSLPLSSRVNTGDQQRCLEYVPALTSSSYVQIPLPGLTANDDFVAVAPPVPLTELQGNNLVVYANTLQSIYNPNSNRQKANVELTDLGNQLVSISYDGQNRFQTQSPARRYFITGSPVSWCLVNQSLRRYTGYARTVAQPTAANLAAAEAAGNATSVLMAENLVNNPALLEYPFRVAEPTLRRNGLVQMSFIFRLNSGDQLELLQEVHLPNVP